MNSKVNGIVRDIKGYVRRDKYGLGLDIKRIEGSLRVKMRMVIITIIFFLKILYINLFKSLIERVVIIESMLIT